MLRVGDMQKTVTLETAYRELYWAKYLDLDADEAGRIVESMLEREEREQWRSPTLIERT